MTESEELTYLRRRLVFLEEQVQRMRLSRRVLMNLLLTQEQVKRGEIGQLQAENERLRQARAGSLRLVEARRRQD